MTAAMRARLEAEFRADVDATGALIGRDLSALWFGSEPSRPEQ